MSVTEVVDVDVVSIGLEIGQDLEGDEKESLTSNLKIPNRMLLRVK